MAEAPAGGAGAGAGAANAQAAIAKHAAVTQADGGGDAATIARVEDAIKNSPMGWLQSMLGEVDSRAADERSQVQGKVDEQKNLVAQNQDKAPKEEGAAPTPGPAAHPQVAQPTIPAHSGPTTPPPATGGTPAQHATLPATPAAKSAAPAAPPAAPAPTIAAAVASAGSDSQLDGILNAYTPKATQTTQTLGRIKQMGDIAQGFNGQLDVYVAQGGAVERGVAATANFLGAGKEAGAVWANNPYRKVHGILGGIMTGLSAVKNVCGVVGNICGKLGIVLTVIGLLGMIFPPIGVAVSGIARILNVVGIICEAVAFALSGILTGLNGVVLAQQIAAGSSAEEKAATADLMMSEANDAASGFVNMAMIFGPKFMSGLMSSSKGVVGALLRRAKATIGRVSIKASGDLKLFANKIVRKLGFGGAAMERVGGAWKDTGMIARTKTAISESRVGKAWNAAPEHLEAIQNKLMAKYGDTAFARGLDRTGAWSGSVASKFDLEEKVGDLGKRAGSAVGNAGSETKFAQNMAAAADQSELETRRLAMQVQANDAAHLEETRWQNALDKRAKANPDEIRSDATEQKFIASRGAAVRADATADFEAKEAKAATDARIEEMKKTRFERHRDEYFSNEQNAFTGKNARDMQMDTLHGSRAKRFELEGEFKTQDAERADLLAKASRSAEDDTKLAALNSQLKPLDEARRLNAVHEKDVAAIAAGGEAVRHPDYKNWGDVGSNVWSAAQPALELAGLKDGPTAWQAAEKGNLKKAIKYDKGKAAGNAAGRGGHGTYADIAATAQQAQMADFANFVRTSKKPQSIGSSVRSMLSPITAKPRQPVASAPVQNTPAPAAPTQSPGPTIAAPPAISETMAITPQVEPAPGQNAAGVAAAGPEPDAPPPTVASVAMAAMEESAAQPLPYWPAMMPDFDHAQSDFDWMRKVGVEFKKAQIEGKQKAVDTLAVYGRYQEYAKLRAAAAAQHQQATGATIQSTQQNVEQAGASESHAGQGESKQGEARGAANQKAAVDLPEPESRGFWGRVLGAVKRWAKDKAAQVFGWIQEKIASVVLKGLCGVSMGDMRDYAGALKRQQAAAHGVAQGGAQTAGQANQTAIKLGADATKEAQSAADAIGECDRNIGDVDNFMADIATFEQQLAEEKAFAQTFLAQLHAEVAATQAKQKADAAAEAQRDARSSAAGTAAAAGGGGVAAVAMAAMNASATTPAPTPTPTPTPSPQPEPEPAVASTDSGDTAAIHSASQYVAGQSDSMAGQLESRADDYHNQLKLALTNHTGKNAQGVDLQGPAKKASKQIVDEFKGLAQHTKTDMDGFSNMSIDPSSAQKIADTIIQSADHLQDAFSHSESALDDLFERTYAGIRDGQRTLKSRLLDGTNVVGDANHAGDAVTNKAIDTSLPTMTTAWNDVAAPIQVAPAPAPPPPPAPAPAPAAPPKLAKSEPGKTATDDGAPAKTDGAKAGVPHQAAMEHAFGTSFGDVTSRTGQGAEMHDMGARAVTQRNQITFAEESPDRELVAHELTHVVQQRQGGANATQAKGITDTDRGSLESEADTVATRVASGGKAGAIGGSTAGSGLRDDDKPTADVFPPPTPVQFAGDRFTITFARNPANKFMSFNMHYDGAYELDYFKAKDWHLDAGVLDTGRVINAKIKEITSTSVSVDLYGDGLTIMKLTDTAEPRPNQRLHSFALYSDRLLATESCYLKLPAETAQTNATSHSGAGGKPAGNPDDHVAAVNFKAVDDFHVTVRKFGDTGSVAVELTGPGKDIPPRDITVPVVGKVDTVSAKVLSNDGREITLDFNGDGKADLRLVHTIATRMDGPNLQTRKHHFAAFDSSGKSIAGPQLDWFLGSAPVQIPANQDESKSPPPAPVFGAPQQGDVSGEVSQAVSLGGDVVEMRIDGDGDRMKELVLRFKGSVQGEQGSIQVDVVQVSSGAQQGHAFPVPAAVARDMRPMLMQAADGHSPAQIHLANDPMGTSFDLNVSPPTTNDQTESYAIAINNQQASVTFPVDKTPVNPLVKTAKALPVAGNIATIEVVLGEYGDRFRASYEPQSGGAAVFSVSAMNAEGPASSWGVQVADPKRVKSFVSLTNDPHALGFDLDGDGKADITIYDAMSAPLGMNPGVKPQVQADRDHVLTLAGNMVGGSPKWWYEVRGGKFVRRDFQNTDNHDGAKEGAGAAAAVQTLNDQAAESRSSDGKGNVKEGDINAVMQRIAGALTANRQKAKAAGLISDSLYNAWFALSDELIQLGPAIKAKGSADPDQAKALGALQAKASTDAATFYHELDAATSGATKDVKQSGGKGWYTTTTTNKYTGDAQTESNIDRMKKPMDGPGMRLPTEITAGKWDQVTADFDALVHGLDLWIADKQQPGSDQQKQQQYLMGMQSSMDEIKSKPGVMRIDASFQPDAGYLDGKKEWSNIPLQLYSWKENGKWWLKDISNPARDPFLDRIDAQDSDTLPPVAIFQQLDYARHFPKGVIRYQIPNGPGGQIVTTERKHWWEFAQWVGLGLAAVGLALVPFGEVVATYAAVAFAASGVAGAVAAGGDLYERAQHGDLNATAVVIDVAQIAAGMLSAGAAISGRIVTVAANASKGLDGAQAWAGAAARVAGFAQKAYVPMIAGAAAADATNLVAMTAQTAQQIEAVMKGAGSPEDKQRAIVMLIAQGIALGGITVLSIKGSFGDISARPTIAIDVVNGIPIARANSIEIGGGQIRPHGGDANAEASARWQSHAIEDAAANPGPQQKAAQALLKDKEFMAGYRQWMEQPEPKVVFDKAGNPTANFGKDTHLSPEVSKKIQDFVATKGVGISLYEKAWAHSSDLEKVEDAFKKQTGGELDLQPNSASWKKARPEVVKELGGDAAAEALVTRYERMRLGPSAGDPHQYLAERAQLHKLLPDSEVDRIRGLFPEYEVYVTGGATQTTKAISPKIDDVDVVVVAKKGTPPEVMSAIEQRALNQTVRPDPEFLQQAGRDPNTTLTLDVKVMTDEQFFGFSAASGGRPGVSPLNFTRIDVTTAAMDNAVSRAGSGTEWVNNLRTRLDPEAQARLDEQLKSRTPNQIMHEYDGHVDFAVEQLSTPGAEKPPALKDTVDQFGDGHAPPSGQARWDYIEEPGHWQPDRAKMQAQLLDKAMTQAQAFADAAKHGEPTMYAMRGNTAAGKTRAVAGNVPELAAPMAQTKNLPYRSVNPDNFKADLISATPGATSTQVHSESSMLASRMEKQLKGMKTSDGSELGSILIDKRLAGVDDVASYMKMAEDGGRKFAMFDVDAPLETSLAGVLERVPGGADPLPPFNIVAGGFTSVRNDRLEVIKLFQANPKAEYTLYAAMPTGERVQIAKVSGGNLQVTNPQVFAEVTAPAGDAAKLIGNKRITSETIDEITKALPADRAKTVGGILRKYEGWTWKSALDAHSVEKPPVTPGAAQ